MSVCLVCQLPAEVYCENDKAFLCKSCDDAIHSANCVVMGHIRKPINCVGGGLSTNYENNNNNGAEYRSSLELEALFDNCDGDYFSNLLEGKGWDDKYDMGFADWMLHGEVVSENQPSHPPVVPMSMPIVDPQPNNPTTVTTGTPMFVKQNVRMVPCFSSTTSYPSLDETDSIPDSLTFLNNDPNMMLPVVPESGFSVVPQAGQDGRKNGASMPTSPTAVIACKASPEDRAAKIARYRAKRDKRNFKKRIRYQTRKAYAEIRPRVKGRFAKRTEVPAATAVQVQNQLYEDFLVPDSQLLVVP